MIECVFSVASVLVLCISLIIHPAIVRCPDDWYANGVRPTGRLTCLRVPGGNPEDDGTYGHPDRSVDRPGRIEARVYCTGGSHPLVIDARTVGCMR